MRRLERGHVGRWDSMLLKLWQYLSIRISCTPISTVNPLTFSAIVTCLICPTILNKVDEWAMVVPS